MDSRVDEKRFMKLRQVVIVGQAPGPGQDSVDPLSGYSGRRLADLIGISMDEFLRFTRTNLNKRCLGKVGKGDDFDMIEGRQTALGLTLLFAYRFDFILLGQKVSQCFGFPWIPLHTFERDGMRYLLVPHTSGINHWYNSPRHRRAASKALRDFAIDE